MQDKEAITRFVRDSLGCQCPDEIFKQIEMAYGVEVEGMPLLARIIIGSRLLIYLTEMENNRQIDSFLEKIIHKGKNERDDKGFNRFRLVIVSEETAVKKALMEKSETEKVGDERIHLHIISHNDPRFQELITLQNKKQKNR